MLSYIYYIYKIIAYPMKKIWPVILLQILLSSCHFYKEDKSIDSRKCCILSGHIDGLGLFSQFAISYQTDSGIKSFNIRTHNGDFILKLPLKEPVPARLYYNQIWRSPEKGNHSMTTVFLDNTAIYVEGRADSLQNRIVRGGYNQYLWDSTTLLDRQFYSQVKYIVDTLNKYYQVQRREAEYLTDTVVANERKKELIDSQLTFHYCTGNRNYELIKSHPCSPVSVYLLNPITNCYPLTDFLYLYNLLDSNLRNMSAAKKYLALAMAKDNVKAGKPAPDFALPGPDGKQIRLSSYKGKITLLVFWGFACPPCREENHELVKIYHKYHSSGLEIISVYQDKNKDRWLEGIKKDSLSWTNVMDTKGWASDVTKMYGINVIPYVFIIDRDGIIIDKNLSKEHIGARLDSLLHNSP
jgi:peroxiredoxin